MVTLSLAIGTTRPFSVSSKRCCCARCRSNGRRRSCASPADLSDEVSRSRALDPGALRLARSRRGVRIGVRSVPDQREPHGRRAARANRSAPRGHQLLLHAGRLASERPRVHAGRLPPGIAEVPSSATACGVGCSAEIRRSSAGRCGRQRRLHDPRRRARPFHHPGRGIVASRRMLVSVRLDCLAVSRAGLASLHMLQGALARLRPGVSLADAQAGWRRGCTRPEAGVPQRLLRRQALEPRVIPLQEDSSARRHDARGPDGRGGARHVDGVRQRREPAARASVGAAARDDDSARARRAAAAWSVSCHGEPAPRHRQRRAGAAAGGLVHRGCSSPRPASVPRLAEIGISSGVVLFAVALSPRARCVRLWRRRSSRRCRRAPRRPANV